MDVSPSPSQPFPWLPRPLKHHPPLQYKPRGAVLLMLGYTAGTAMGVRGARGHLRQVSQGQSRSPERWHRGPASFYHPAQLRRQLSSLPCSLLTTEFI